MALYRNYNQAGLDAQYNNRARVPGHQTHIDRWATDSAAVRATADGRLDIAYGPAERERLDIFSAGPSAPVLAFIHGGYWKALDKDHFSYPAPAFKAAGISWVTIGYPLAPAATMDDIVDAVRRALAWLWREGAGHGLDPNRLFVTGHSAGGHLTAVMLSTDWPRFDAALPGDLVKGGCAISGIYDLEPIRLSFMNDEIGLDPAMVGRHSPIRHVDDGGGRLVVAVGAEESPEFLRQQDDFATARRAAGKSVTVVDAPGDDHFSVVAALARPDSALFGAVKQLVERPDYT
ncbi:MAG: alpha/beta hydrolase [Alphaproteobacteria bacterium]|nr:alpha/beta hydrolase [Alphaproteobacteria bacterium]